MPAWAMWLRPRQVGGDGLQKAAIKKSLKMNNTCGMQFGMCWNDNSF
jgi:hypothetical protein